MDITVVTRSAEIRPNFRAYVEEEVSEVMQFYPRAQRVDVELTYEHNPRQADAAEYIELTVYGKGPIIRAEAESADRYATVDIAAGKSSERLRRTHDRARDHRRRYPCGLDEVEMIEEVAPVEEVPAPEASAHLRSAEDLKVGEAREGQLGDSPITVRQKVHEAAPMAIDEILDRMETVGHLFSPFVSKDTRQPCVAYHRHGWTYGVPRLNTMVEQDGVSLHHINETRAPASLYTRVRMRRVAPVDTSEFVRRGPRGRVVLVGISEFV